MDKKIEIDIFEICNILDNIGYDLSETKQLLDNLEEKLKQKEKQSIKDINNFKIELRKNNLYTDEIENFIEQYMNYYNN